MTFQFPLALWWLAPLLGAILLLYLLKMRRRDVRVPATFLWPQRTADVRANAPIQRLRFSLLLLVQLLIAALLVFGLANPLRRSRGLHGRATVVVLDTSASMNATDVAPTRFEAARRRIEGLIGSMGTQDRLALIAAGPTTRVVFPLSNEKAKMTAALRTLEPTDAPNAPGEALRLAAALVGQREGGRIVVISDGAFGAVSDFSPGKAQIVFDPVGSGRRNLAVTALEAADTPAGAQVFAGIRNYHDAPVKTTVTFRVDGRVADARSVTVPAGQSVGETLPINAAARRVDVQIESKDLLAADNRAALYLQGSGAVRTLLVSAGNLFLERALALDPRIRLDRAPSVPRTERAGTSGKTGYDMVIFDGIAPTPVKAPAVWAWGAVGGQIPVADEGASRRPRTVARSGDHPVLRHVDFDGVLIEKARKVRPTGAGRTLLEGSDGPLVVASERGGRRTLYVAWAALDSDFPLRIGFPVFVSNAVAWLTGGRTTGGGMSVPAGRPFSVAVADNAKSVTLRGPGGANRTIDAATGAALVRGADRVGDYTLNAPSGNVEIAVNLLDADESDIAPRAALDLSGTSVAAKGSTLVLAEMWRPLVLLALLLLAGEWWLFARRS